MIEVRLRGEANLRRLSERLRRSQGILRRELKEALREAARPAVVELKSEIEHAEVGVVRTSGVKKRGTFRKTVPAMGPLRRPIARAVESDISTGSGDPRVRIWVREASIPARVRRVVKFIVGNEKRWRHPIMGNRKRWVERRTPNLWDQIIPKHLRRFRREVDEAVAETARRIER